MIPAALGGGAVGGLDERADLVALKVLHDTRAGPLEGHGEEALAGFEVFGVSRGDEASEGVDGCEAGVACRGAVLAAGLEILEERNHAVRVDVAEVEVHHVPAPAGREEPQEQHEGVAVAQGGVRAEATREG